MVEQTLAAQKEKLKDLGTQKTGIENRLNDIRTQLNTMAGAPGLHGALVDDEVFNQVICPASRKKKS
jgi:hypothetical protein